MAIINKKDSKFIKNIVENNGPDPYEYDILNNFFFKNGEIVRKGIYNRKELNPELWELLGDAVSEETMQGRVIIKPYGYAGDFEIIDHIYTNWVTPNQKLKKWDYYFHSHAAVKAVRNRKKYFIDLIKKFENKSGQSNIVLCVGSGPGRDIFEYFSSNSSKGLTFDCVDMDINAIQYSEKLCVEYAHSINFYSNNIFRFRTDKYYNLIWSAGLFDYLDDRHFVYLLTHLYKMLAKGGKLIIGNFSTFNPSRDYMEAGDWYLFHRSEQDLISLALKSSIEKKNIKIEAEEERINLFMHIQK